MDRVVRLGCIVCWSKYLVHTPAEVHHIDGKTKPGAHFKVLPLCAIHHRLGLNKGGVLILARHQNKAAFEKAYGTEAELLQKVEHMLDKQGVRVG